MPERIIFREWIDVCMRDSVEGTTSPHLSDSNAASHFCRIDAVEE